MEKKAVERAKSVFNTALFMLRDLEVLQQSDVKQINSLLEHYIKLNKVCAKTTLVDELKKRGQYTGKIKKQFEGVGKDDI